MTNYKSQSSKKKTKEGTKARQREDKEDRSLAYRDYRRMVGTSYKDGRKRKTAYVSDIDQIEYIFVDDKPVPIALFEITRYDFDEYDLQSHSWAKYRTSILDRYFSRDSQGKFIVTIAKLLNCNAYIILFRYDVQSFWIFDLMNKNAFWLHKNADEYKEWLAELRTSALEKMNV